MFQVFPIKVISWIVCVSLMFNTMHIPLSLYRSSLPCSFHIHLSLSLSLSLDSHHWLTHCSYHFVWSHVGMWQLYCMQLHIIFSSCQPIRNFYFIITVLIWSRNGQCWEKVKWIKKKKSKKKFIFCFHFYTILAWCKRRKWQREVIHRSLPAIAMKWNSKMNAWQN